MKVTVALPARSYVPSLETSLASIFVAHCFHPISLKIVLQFASSKTAFPASLEKILEVFAAREVEVVVNFRRDNGVAQALNRAFSLCDKATGSEGDRSFLTYLGAGDLLDPGCFKRLAETVRINPNVNWSTGAVRVLQQNGASENYKPDPAFHNIGNFLERKFAIQAEGTFVREEAFRDVGGFDEELKLAFDFDLWLRLLASCDLYVLPSSTGVFSVHPGQLSEDMDSYQLEAQSALNEFFRKHRVRDLYDIVHLP